MFWIFILIAGGAATFAMYIFWFKVLTAVLLMTAIIILGVTSWLLWRRICPNTKA